MYLAAGEFTKAVEIMGQNGWVERCVCVCTCPSACVASSCISYLKFSMHETNRILNLVHDLDKSETEVLQSCAHHLKRLSQYNSAAEVFEKLGDFKALVSLHIETQQWTYVSHCRLQCTTTDDIVWPGLCLSLDFPLLFHIT